MHRIAVAELRTHFSKSLQSSVRKVRLTMAGTSIRSVVYAIYVTLFMKPMRLPGMLN